jgi:hypothetical protein
MKCLLCSANHTLHDISELDNSERQKLNKDYHHLFFQNFEGVLLVLSEDGKEVKEVKEIYSALSQIVLNITRTTEELKKICMRCGSQVSELFEGNLCSDCLSHLYDWY